MDNKSGKLVMNKDGVLGRTYNSKGLVNGKIPFYKATKIRLVGSMEVPSEYSDQAVLCDPLSLKVVGFIN